MKKQLLLLILLFLGSIGAWAQSFTVTTPDTVITSGVANDVEIICKSVVRNNTSSPLQLKWVRITNAVPQGWQSSVCDDNNGCYAPSVDSQTLNVPANGTARLDVHFYPGGNAGNATARIRISPMGQGASKTVTYVSNAFPTAVQEASKPLFSFYPNPVRSTLNVRLNDNVKTGTIEVYSVIGTLLLAETISPMDEVIPLQISHLPRGTYIIRLNSPQQGIVLSRTFQKI